jgi:hypothetical protein
MRWHFGASHACHNKDDCIEKVVAFSCTCLDEQTQYTFSSYPILACLMASVSYQDLGEQRVLRQVQRKHHYPIR